MALDASMDINDTEQLLLFIRMVNNKLELTEELTPITSLYGTTTC